MAVAAYGDFHVSHTGVELSKTFAEIAASCGAVDGCGATQEPAGKQHKPSWESHIRQHAGRHRRKQAWISGLHQHPDIGQRCEAFHSCAVRIGRLALWRHWSAQNYFSTGAGWHSLRCISDSIPAIYSMIWRPYMIWCPLCVRDGH